MSNFWTSLKDAFGETISPKGEVEVYDKQGFRYRILLSPIPRTGEKILLDGFWHVILDVLHFDDDLPRIVVEQCEVPLNHPAYTWNG